MVEEINLNFIRHGKHNTSKDDPLPEICGLLNEGVVEARSVGERLELDPDYTVVFTIENDRSLATSFLVLYPDKDLEEHNIGQCLANGKIKTSPQLGYKPVNDPTFSSMVGRAFKQGTNLAFLVGQSDSYRLSTGNEVSSYTAIAYEVALIVDKYIKICQSWPSRASKRNEHLALQRVFCAREFVYPCFRAKLLEQVEGIDARDAYVRWYGESMEWNSAARTDVSTICIEHIYASESFDRITISDEYGTLVIDPSYINNIIAEYEELFNKVKKYD
jgi:hypothetical protein